MPVSVEQVLQLLEEKTSLSHNLIKKIDEQMSDARVVRNNRCGEGDNFSYRFSFEGNATKGDKAYLIEQYRQAGWGYVEVINSEENGERAGMVGVILHRYAPLTAE